jgi:hypothetical protein
MTEQELEIFKADTEAKQAAYREHRRSWAYSTDNPYLEDGGDKGNRSGDAAPRVAQTKTGTNF